MSRYSASVYNYLFNSVNSTVMIVNGIIMVPLYFKFMSVSTYGAWLATGNLVSMLGLVESGFAGVVTQKMSAAITNKDNIKFLQLAGANIYTALLMASVLFLVGILFSHFISEWVNADPSIKQAITIAFIIALASASISLLVSLWGAFPQVWQDTKTIGMINAIVNLVAIIFLIIYLFSGFGVISLALGYLTRAVLNLFFQGTWILLKWRNMGLPKPVFCIETTKSLLKECFYPFLSKVSNLFMGNSQSFIIAFFLSPTLAAIYDITSKIAAVSCNFVNMINGSFFALFSLTFATKDKEEINKLVKEVTSFFMVLLFTVILYSFCFTKPIVKYWVGLDKYGGNLLLIAIVSSLLVLQIKNYFNNLLYTGGLIKKSAKLDILSMIMYILILISIVNNVQVYAIPLAGLVTGILFIGLYLRLLKKELLLNIESIIKLSLCSFLLIIPFAVLHVLIDVDLMKLPNFIVYGFIFTLFYITIIAVTNKALIARLLFRLGYAKKA